MSVAEERLGAWPPALDARRWAALVGHVLSRASVVDEAAVEVRSAGGRAWFVVPDGDGMGTLEDAQRAVIPVAERAADVVVALEPDGAEGTAGTWLVTRGSRDEIEVSCRAGGGPLDPAAFAAALARLVRAVTEEPTRPLGALSLADAREVASVLALSGTIGDAVEETPLGRLRRRADALGDTIIEDVRGATTIREIVAAAERLAGALFARGVRSGGMVGLHLRRTRDEIIGRFAAWMLGAAFVPLDPKQPRARLEYMIANSGATIVLSDAATSELGAKVELLPMALAKAVGGKRYDPSTPRLADLAYVLYTSGSTGQPKGVEITHGNLATLMEAMRGTFDLGAADVICALAAFSFDMSVPDWLLPFWVGCRLAIASEEDLEHPSRIAALCERIGATFVQATPTRYRQLVEAGWRPQPRLRRLVGGEALGEDLAGQLLASGGEVWNMYGPTEAAVWVTTKRIRAASDYASIGRPFASTTFRVVDRVGKLAPRDFPGELYLGGHHVGMGYRGREDLTRERFVSDPTGTSSQRMYRTGDRVRLRSDGDLEFFGRLDAQVKIRGYRVELEEVEAALRALPGIRAAAAKVDSTAGVAKLLGYVVADTGSAPTPAEMKAILRERLPEYMVPTLIVTLAALPTTRAGKLDRLALPAPEAEAVVPASALEAKIAAAVAQAFGLPAVDPTEDFTDLGGFSLARMSLLVTLRAAGVEVSLPELYRASTARALAAQVETAAPRVEARVDMTTIEVPGVGRAWPTSGIQQKMYLDVVASKIPGQWHVVLALALYEHVEVAKLREAIALVFARHDALRCSFHLLEDGTLAQLPLTGPGFAWREASLALPPGGVPELQAGFLTQSFDLQSGILNEFVAVTTPEADRLLFWITHEIIGDAWSVVLVLREVELAYHQLTAGGSGIESTDVGFAAHLDRTRREGAASLPAMERLFGAPREEPGEAAPGLPLAVDALRRRLGVTVRAVVPCSTETTLSAPMPFAPKLAAACRRLGVTSSVLVQAAFLLALMKSDDASSRLGPRSAALGMYVTNRTPDEERSVGHFSTFFPLVASVGETVTVKDWVTSLRHTMRDILSIESAFVGDVLRRVSPEVVERAVGIQFADDRYPWFLAEATDDEKIFDFLTPFVRSHVRISVVAMTKPPFLVLLRTDPKHVSIDASRKLLSDIFEAGKLLVEASDDDRVADWLPPVSS